MGQICEIMEARAREVSSGRESPRILYFWGFAFFQLGLK